MPEPSENELSPAGATERASDLPEPTEGSRPLTPEEQMAAFEKELKENDWGHQPC